MKVRTESDREATPRTRPPSITTFVVAALHAESFGRRATARPPLERDHQLWQKLVFDHDGKGTWTAGGMGSYAPGKRVDFRWQRDRTTLTAVSGGESRTVGYEIKRRNDSCFLSFDDRFLLDEHQSQYYSDFR